MFSQAIKTKLVFALLLAMLMAWGGHAAAWLVNPSPPDNAAAGHLHAHLHDDDQQFAEGCTLCQLQHKHSPLTADHLHETPYPTAFLKLHAPGERDQPQVALRHVLPDAPVFLIERPPRSRFVL